MKKILFIAPRNPFVERFSGDVIRTKKFITHLAKKNSITIIALDKKNTKNKIGKINLITFKEENIIIKLINMIKSFLKFEPIQLGYFYSNKMKKYIENLNQRFDIIFCQSIRTAQYVNIPTKKKILDMGDLYSYNYFQTFKLKSYFNIFKYIYLLESFLMKSYENLCLKKFNKILLFSKKEIETIKNYKKKINQIYFGIDKVNNKFKFSVKNYKIIFIGNINYLPNREACKYFITNILKKILAKDPSIQFHIIGNISKLDKFIFERNKSVIVHGKINKLNKKISKAICGLANLNVSSGIQTKILTYMSLGLPCISNIKVIENFDKLNTKFLPTYKNDNELIKLIFKLKNDQKFSDKISKKSLIEIKKFKWDKVLGYLKI